MSSFLFENHTSVQVVFKSSQNELPKGLPPTTIVVPPHLRPEEILVQCHAAEKLFVLEEGVFFEDFSLEALLRQYSELNDYGFLSPRIATGPAGVGVQPDLGGSVRPLFPEAKEVGPCWLVSLASLRRASVDTVPKYVSMEQTVAYPGHWGEEAERLAQETFLNEERLIKEVSHLAILCSNVISSELSALSQSFMEKGVVPLFCAPAGGVEHKALFGQKVHSIEETVTFVRRRNLQGVIVACGLGCLPTASLLRYLTSMPLAVAEACPSDCEIPALDHEKFFNEAAKGFFVSLGREAFRSAHASSLLSDIENQYQRLTCPDEPKRGVSVILPVHNAFDAVRACLASLERDESLAVKEIIVVDDASEEPVRHYLEQYCGDNYRYIRLDQNRGFIGACRAGLELANKNHDVVLLNSDVVLSSSALTRLRKAAYKRANIAVASALSTGSPHLQVDLNTGDSLESFSRDFLAKRELKSPTVITPEGQLLFIKRQALENFGFFDDVYGRGFCEESDYCMRVFGYGADTVCADTAIISHRRQASYGIEEKAKLLKANRKIFDARWSPIYVKAYQEFQRQNPLADLRSAYGKSSRYAFRPFSAGDQSVEALLAEIEFAIGKPTPMKGFLPPIDVGFVLPRVVRGGGTLSVLQHVNQLLLRGIEARVFSLGPNDLPEYPLLAPVIPITARELLSLEDVALIATFWPTAYLLSEMKQGFYYVQDYEPWFYPEGSRLRAAASASYQRGLKTVCKTSFLAKTLLDEQGIEATEISPGIDRGIFYAGEQERHFGRPRLSALFRSQTVRRGARELIQVVRSLVDRLPELEIRFFGDSHGLPEDLLPHVEMLGELAPQQVGKLYRDSDIVVDMSHWHGFGRLGIEGLCCGAVPVLTDSGGVRSYAEESFLIRDTEEASERIVLLCRDREKRLELRRKGLARVSEFSEERAVDDWIELLKVT